MRILLAGVPFGCNNVGDEAILQCAVKIFTEVSPGAQLTVSTRDQERTAAKLGVETCGLLGFFGDVSPAETKSIIAAHDCFVWCGATGLSDYPHVTPKLMRIAQQLGKQTILWGVGMNDDLNPFHYRVLRGRRYSVLKTFRTLSFGLVDTIGLVENHRKKRSYNEIAQCLNSADLLVVRDAQSRDELLKCGVAEEIIVGADSAMLLEPDMLEEIALAPGSKELILSDVPKIGLCVSEQGQITNQRGLTECLDEILSNTNAYIVGIPMNPLTDSALMARLAGQIKFRDRMLVLTGEYQPSEVLAVASHMDVVVSSRLHLLILASIVNVPIVGISRGSKVDNYLNMFGLSSVGSVRDPNFLALKDTVLSSLADKQSYLKRSAEPLENSLQRLAFARKKLADTLDAISRN